MKRWKWSHKGLQDGSQLNKLRMRQKRRSHYGLTVQIKKTFYIFFLKKRKKDKKAPFLQYEINTCVGVELTAFTLAHIRWKPAHFRADTMSCKENTLPWTQNIMTPYWFFKNIHVVRKIKQRPSCFSTKVEISTELKLKIKAKSGATLMHNFISQKSPSGTEMST